MTPRLASIAACLALLVSHRAHAQPHEAIAAHVVDVAGGRVYLDVGEGLGVRVGSAVHIDADVFVVVAVSHASAVFVAGERRVAVGTPAHVDVQTAGDPRTELRRAEVLPLEAARERWSPPTAPASAQSPAYVPLGVTSEHRRARFLLASTTSAYIPLGGGTPLLREQLRTRVHAEPIRNVPFTIDADATLQLYAARDLQSLPGGSSRPVLRVQRLELSYGREQDFFVALGRLWNAAQGVGMLDGVRMRAPTIRGVTVGAFGGLVPRLFDNIPSLDAGRFGVEANYRDLERRSRPSLDLVMQGSFYGGRVDERRLSAFAAFSPRIGRFGAYAVLDLHDKDNPWNAHRAEVSSAGASASIRRGRWEGGARLDYRRPDRSRFLASQLPASWLCGGLGSNATACQTQGDGRYFLSADSSVRVGARAVVGAGGSFAKTPAAQTYQGSGFVQMRLAGLWEVGRVNVTASAYGGSLLASYALAVEGGATFVDGLLDVTVHYRPAISVYASDLRAGVDHLVGTSLRVDPGHAFTAALSFDAFAGHDVHALLAQCTVAYRPSVR